MDPLYQKKSPFNPLKHFEKYFQETEQYTATIDGSLQCIQHNERFKIQKNDPIRVRILKPLKKALFNITQWPVKSGNQLRKWKKKPPMPPRQWHQQVPLKNLTENYYKYLLVLEITNILEKQYQLKSEIIRKIWDVFEENEKIFSQQYNDWIFSPEGIKSFDQSDVSEAFDDCLELTETHFSDIEIMMKEVHSNIDEQYDEAFLKAGTLELPASGFDQQHLARKEKEMLAAYEKMSVGWGNTLYALFGDWSINVELYRLKYYLLGEFHHINLSCKKKFDANLYPPGRKTAQSIQKNTDEIRKKNYKSNKTFVEDLKQRKGLLSDSLTEFSAKVNQLLISQDLPLIVSDFENKLELGIATLPEKKAFLKDTDYDSESKSSDISHISPQVLLNYELVSNLKDSLNEIKTRIIQRVNEVQVQYQSLSSVLDFNIESSIVILDQPEKTLDDGLNLAVEGLERVNQKILDSEQLLKDLKISILESINQTIVQFVEEIIKLTNVKNILLLNVKITTEKALKWSQLLKNKSFGITHKVYEFAIEKLKYTYRWSGKSYRYLQKQLALPDETRQVKTEISDYLSKSQHAIAKLPFVYQRLYEVRALSDPNFFLHRTRESEILNKALESWQEGNYAPVIIRGEKGSGITTLLNFFIEDLKTGDTVIRTSFESKLNTVEDFALELCKIMDLKTTESIDEIIQQIGEKYQNQIIVLENIQHLFIRKIKGFEVMKAFFRILSATNQQIFWITSMTTFAWIYLVKTISIDDYFGYIVKMKDFSKEQLVDFVSRRNRVSGYKITYQPDLDTENNKAFKKTAEEQKQDYLKSVYFDKLGEFAHSNLSLALTYWLCSTVDVSDNVINIKPADKIDISFLNGLSTEKIFTLNNLLLHGGLTVTEHAVVFDYPEEKSNLILNLLFDDGIIINTGDMFTVNPLLYRHIINLLKSKNLLH